MRVLVTGGAGFIGSRVVLALAGAGHEVVALDNLHPAAHRAASAAGLDLPPGLVVGDVRDSSTMDAVLSDIDVVVHHAAMVGMGADLNDLPEYASCNDLGTAVLLAAMARAGVGHLILASSMVVYGEGAYDCVEHGRVGPAPRREADLAEGRFEPRCPRCDRLLEPGLVEEGAPVDPRSTYAATKLAQENLARAWALSTGGVATALRYHNVYGPGMPRDTPYSGVAAIFRSSLERGEAPRVFEDGGQRRDFVHVDDVAAANLAALRRPTPAGDLRPVNVCSGRVTTILELATALADSVAGPAPVVTGRYRAGDVRHVTASPRRAADELGFAAAIPFAVGMRELAVAALRS